MRPASERSGESHGDYGRSDAHAGKDRQSG